MWGLICDIFKKNSQLRKLAARRNFYTATMNEREKILAYAPRILHLSSTLKSMGVVLDGNEMAMALFNDLSDRLYGLISALDALYNDDLSFRLEFFKRKG